MITSTELTAAAGVLLSLVFSYVPNINTWYAAKPPEEKRAIMLGLIVAVALVTFGIACAGLGPDFGIKATCDRAGAIGMFQAIVLAAIANQTTYMVTPKPMKVKIASKASWEAEQAKLANK